MLPAQVHRRIYLVLLALLGACMITSVWASNLVWVLLGANWLLEGRWREKWRMARNSRLLQAVVVSYLLCIIGLLWTNNINHGLSVLQVKMPLLFVPLVLLTTRPVEGKARRNILWFYSAAVIVVSFIGLVRALTIPELPYRDTIPYISHIRFSLNCCMVIYLCFNAMIQVRSPWRFLFLLPALWLLVFVVVWLHSYTAVAILAVVSLLILLLRYRRWSLIALWVLVVGVAMLLVCREVKSYYRMVPMAQEPLRPYTEAGHPYLHMQDGIIENGNYVNNYLCDSELCTEWNRRSKIPYKGLTGSGYSVKSTLIRYLNALGLTKDSVGVSRLTAEQISDIERGVANPVYENGNPLKKMVYVMLLEREFYVHTHAVSGFTMLQRFELWDATLDVARRNLWFGVGTGDVGDELHAVLAQRHSELSGTSKMSHNQYLSILAAFGVVGFVVVLSLFLRAAPRLRRQSALMLAWLFTILISCLTEDTFGTLAGILFSTYFLAFRDDESAS